MIDCHTVILKQHKLPQQGILSQIVPLLQGHKGNESLEFGSFADLMRKHLNQDELSAQVRKLHTVHQSNNNSIHNFKPVINKNSERIAARTGYAIQFC